MFWLLRVETSYTQAEFRITDEIYTSVTTKLNVREGNGKICGGDLV